MAARWGYVALGAKATHSTTCSWPRKEVLGSPDAASQSRGTWSLPALRSHRPSIEAVTARTQSVWPLIVFRQYPVVTSHTRKVLSLEAETNMLPDSGLPAAPEGTKRIEDMEWSWPGNVRMFLYSSLGSHSFIVRSLLQLASNVPPRGPPKSTSSTGFVWPFRVRSSSPNSQSQIFIVVSSELEAREENIGWNATAVTGSR